MLLHNFVSVSTPCISLWLSSPTFKMMTNLSLAFFFSLLNEHHYLLFRVKFSVSPSLKFWYTVSLPLAHSPEKTGISLSVPLNYCIEYSGWCLECYLFLYLFSVIASSRIQSHTRGMHINMCKCMHTHRHPNTHIYILIAIQWSALILYAFMYGICTHVCMDVWAPVVQKRMSSVLIY